VNVATVRSRAVPAYDRLDAHYFTSPGVAASERLAVLEAAGAPTERLGDLAAVWDPPRFSRAYAAPLEPSAPYLRPYDVFDYLPEASDRLSRLRNVDLERLTPPAGTILQTCSGRNLGPLTIADATLAGYALSHDMIRVDVVDEPLRYYLLTFLKTPTGQALLRRSRAGSVIDHITVADVAALTVPMTTDDVRGAVADRMRRGVGRAAEARAALAALLERRAHAMPVPAPSAPARDGWAQLSTSLTDRLDAAYYEPRVTAVRATLAAGGAGRLGDLATAHLPARYKRYYVDPEHGRAILSGRQLLQLEPVNLRYVSDRSFRNPAEYELTAGMTVFGAVGRSEGRQGTPALITPERHGWLASNDVMRLTPRPGIRPGALWLAIAARPTRLQINALSFGSVIDHMNPWDVEDLLVSDVPDHDAENAENAWADLSQAVSDITSAVHDLETALAAPALLR
jgi:hypothetical protein